MNNDLTDNSLGIFWQGEEVNGVIAYGYWKGHIREEPRFPQQAWNEGTLYRTSRLRGEGWEVCLWDVRVLHWSFPQSWEDTLKATLTAMMDAGAKVAWCGLEGFFVDPPDLFKPGVMSGSVYATMSAEYGFQCSAHMGLPFKALPDEDLEKLQALL